MGLFLAITTDQLFQDYRSGSVYINQGIHASVT